MPTKKTVQRARKDAREGKAATTQAGEFVREEMEHKKEGRHSKGNPKQAIAIGLSKARRAGVKLPPPKKGKASAATRKKAERDYARGQSQAKKTAKKSKSTSSRSRTTAKKSGGRKRTAAKSSAKRSR